MNKERRYRIGKPRQWLNLKGREVAVPMKVMKKARSERREETQDSAEWVVEVTSEILKREWRRQQIIIEAGKSNKTEKNRILSSLTIC